MDLNRLKDFFSADDIEWKPIAIAKSTGKGLAAAYVTNRAIMDRLDDVCGPENWKNEFVAGPGGGVMCGISIRIGEEWITKWDGAENTDIEPVKGGLSSSMRRAAVQWGIGRYLYNLPGQWTAVDERGRFVQPPKMPREFLPASGQSQTTLSRVAEPSPAMQPASKAAAGTRRREPARPRTDAPQKPGAEEFFMP